MIVRKKVLPRNCKERAAIGTRKQLPRKHKYNKTDGLFQRSVAHRLGDVGLQRREALAVTGILAGTVNGGKARERVGHFFSFGGKTQGL